VLVRAWPGGHGWDPRQLILWPSHLEVRTHSPSAFQSVRPFSLSACLDVMELAGRLAQQHAQELKEALRLPGDRANQARTQLQALAQTLHHILSSDGEERGATAAMVLKEQGAQHSSEEVSRIGKRVQIPSVRTQPWYAMAGVIGDGC
jgi:hypothetical protein